MSDQERWEERYRTGDTPWDIGRPDFNLIDMVTKRPIPAGKALEIGCGAGSNAVWLAQQNFQATATDVSELAIQKAGERASDAGVDCTFLVADFLNDKVPGAPFGLVFDRGCFHSFDSDEERKQLAENVDWHLERDGLWLSLIGSTDGPPREVGPPQRSARDIVIAVEPYFEILSLDSSHFDADSSEPPRNWVCLMRKRGKT
ncbi:MAG: class I SAM-dependent methyltransferase [Desulfobacteria bacterium]